MEAQQGKEKVGGTGEGGEGLEMEGEEDVV